MAGQRPIFDPNRMAVQKHAAAVPRMVSVSQLNALIKNILTDHLPPTIHLVGEISNFTRAGSGHLYMTLKDDRSEFRVVMWRSSATSLKFDPDDGLEVIATGHVDVYEPRGQYQFYARKLEPRGVGALELAFRQLHDRLAAEGLFDPRNKKPIPPHPRRIAVVTSPTGAAIRDIIETLQRRFPCVSVLLHPVRVQGEGSAKEIADAIRRLNDQADRMGGIDLIIVGRGGGSLEDLWAFNEEVVARAVHASRLPIISAVGHEIDVTICDLVADLRAPTPTAAAELAVPVLDEILETLTSQAGRLRRAARHRLDLARSRLDAVARCEWFRDPLEPVHRSEQRLDEVSSRLQLNWSQLLAGVRRRLHEIEIVLAAIQPRTFLQQQRTRLVEATHRLRWAVEQRTRLAERRWEQTRHNLLLASPAPRLQAAENTTQQLTHNLGRGMRHRLRLTRQTLDALEACLEATSHRRTLARGFTITRSRDDRRIITRADHVAPGEHVLTETADGEFESQVTTRKEGQESP